MADEAVIRSLLERDGVARAVNTLFTATDVRGGQRVRSCLRLEDGAWKIGAFRFALRFVDGNARLESEPGA